MVAGTGEDGNQFRAIFGGHRVQESNQRQGGLLLGQIGAQRFAHHGLGTGEIEHVVGDLKGDAQIMAIAGQGLADGRLGAA